MVEPTNPGVELPTAPQADVDLDVRALRTYLALDDDNDPVLVLCDGDNTVIVQFGLGGAWESAIDGALGLNEAALRFAVLLRDRYANASTTVSGTLSPTQPEETKSGGAMQVSKDGRTVDLTGVVWRRSSLSGPYSDNCVEVTGLDGELVAVRDSKNPDGPVLTFTSREWDVFVAGAKLGEFDRAVTG